MTCAELQARLDALLEAQYQLALGGTIVKVRAGEKEIQYGAKDGARLDQGIRQIRLLMARQGCTAGIGFIRTTPSDC